MPGLQLKPLTAELQILNTPGLDLSPGAGAPVLSTIAAIQAAAGFDHIYAFDPLGTPTDDDGGAPAANLTVEGVWTNAAPTAQGSVGRYENTTDNSAGNRLTAPVAGINMARTADIWWEGVFSFDVLPGTSAGAIAMAGTFNDAAGHSLVTYTAGTGAFALLAPNFTTVSFMAGLDGNYMLLAPTYLAVWWNHAATRWEAYWRKIGEPESSSITGAFAAGSPGNAQLWISGNGVNVFTPLMVCHAFGLNRGALTPAHRNNIYAAMGII